MEQEKRQKEKLRKLFEKKLKDMESRGLLRMQSDTQKLLRKDKSANRGNRLSSVSDVERIRNVMALEGFHKKRKRSRHKESSDDDSEDDSDDSRRELLRDNQTYNWLKEKLESIETKQILLSKMIESKRKEKFDSQIIRKKLELLDTITKLNRNAVKPPAQETSHTKSVLINRPSTVHTNTTIDPLELRRKKKMLEKLKTVLTEEKAKKPVVSLRQKMMEKLKAARFRFLNEQIYTTTSQEAQKIFQSDPDAFLAYHEGYRQQVRSWPLNPLDVIIKSIKKMPKNCIVADFGCGDAKLAKSVEQRVVSFDLVAVDETVTACDMSKVPLDDDSVDVAVFCLSLMGTNLQDYILEANRVLKFGGVLKIAEVESRFENVDLFIEGVKRYGFKKTWKDLSHDLFYFIDFIKHTSVMNKKKLPTISLLPCLYKKR